MFDFDGGQFSNLTHPSRQPSFGIMIDHHHPDFLTTKKTTPTQLKMDQQTRAAATANRKAVKKF